LPLLDQSGNITMSNVDVKIQGLDKLIKKLNNIAGKSYLKATMRAAVEILKAKVAKYPPSTEANLPHSVPGWHWYERGRGGHYNRIRDGGHSAYRTSKQLGRKWTTRVDADGMRAQVGNNVSYAPYVQDEREQMPWHKDRGWVTVQDVAKSEKDKIVKLFVANIKKAINER
jgi:hypothetical protein